MADTEDLKSILDSYHTQGKQLLNLLQAEQKALGEENYQDIVAITQSKQELLAQIEKTDLNIVSAMGTSPEQNAIPENNLIKSNTDPSLKTIWQEVSKLLQECNQLNLVNGAVISARLNGIRRYLDLMLNPQADGPVSYDQKGSVIR